MEFADGRLLFFCRRLQYFFQSSNSFSYNTFLYKIHLANVEVCTHENAAQNNMPYLR